jgi:DNA-binding Lrp family transcriptional regulator
MAIFRSQLQGELLARVLLAPGNPSVSDLARELNAPFSTVQREVQRLVGAGILHDVRVGRTRTISVNTENIAYRPLRDLVLVTFGPRHVVEEEFSELPGLEGLLIYGSWAARYTGAKGPEPGDVDVLVIGAVDRDAAYDAAEKAQKRLGREVNPTVVSRRRWRDASDPFLVQLRGRPLVRIRDIDIDTDEQEPA